MSVEIEKAKESDFLNWPGPIEIHDEYKFKVDHFDLSRLDEKEEYCRLRMSDVFIQKRTDIIHEQKLIIWIEYWDPVKKKED